MIYVSPSVERATRAPRRVRGSVMRTAISPPSRPADLLMIAAATSSRLTRPHTPIPTPTHVDQHFSDDAAHACHAHVAGCGIGRTHTSVRASGAGIRGPSLITAWAMASGGPLVDKGGVARPRAADEQFVGVGKGNVLPSRKEGARGMSEVRRASPAPPRCGCTGRDRGAHAACRGEGERLQVVWGSGGARGAAHTHAVRSGCWRK